MFRFDSDLNRYVIDWVITINDVDRNGFADQDYTGKHVVITDHLPQGLTLVESTVMAAYNRVVDSPPPVTQSGGDVIFDPVDVQNRFVTLSYSTAVTPAALSDNTIHQFINAAEVTVDGNLLGRSRSTREVPPQLVNKAGSQSDFLIDYSIQVNSMALDLSTGSTLTLSDTLQQGLVLSTGSIRVLDADSQPLNSSQYAVHYDGSTRTLRFTLPDQQALRVLYSVQLMGTLNETKTVTNTARLVGVANASSTSSGVYTVKKSSATVEADRNALQVKKIDADNLNTVLAGAVFRLSRISAATGAVLGVVETLTTPATGIINFINLNMDQIYLLEETQAPAGYAISFAPYYFVVPGTDATDWPSVFSTLGITNYGLMGGSLIVSDALLRTMAVTVSKQSITGTDELPGASLSLVDADSNEVEFWVSGDTPHLIAAELTPGATYTITEVMMPSGYTRAESIQFTVNTDGTPQTVVMKDKPTDVTFSKQALGGGAELPGAHLQLKDVNGDVIEEWISTTVAHRIVAELQAGGIYTFAETSAPDGYAMAQEVTFTVGADGTPQTITLIDAPSDVSLSKVSLIGGEELPGAHLQVKDSAGVVVEEWVSGDTPHQILAKLKPGQHYTFVETIAPAGYALAEAIDFIVASDGQPQLIPMVDKPTDVTISKRPWGSSAELAGAHLRLLDWQGSVVEEWDSGTTAHRLVAKLLAGQTYRLEETSAPTGYLLASAITFTVNADGTAQTIIMYDASSLNSSPSDVTFSKQSITGTAELPGAVLSIQDANGTVLHTWTSTTTPHRLVNVLFPGFTYTLVEVTAPNGYTVAESVTFTVNADSTPQTVTMRDAPTDVTFSKLSLTGTAELPGAVLSIRDARGTVIETWTSTTTPHQVTATLIAGATYTLVEVTAPNGYTVAESVTFTVNADGTPQTVTMRDAPTDVTFSKLSLTGTAELPGAVLSIRDARGTVIETWTSTTTPHQVTATLIAGATYTLVEVTAPNGYTVAESVTFTVNADGTPQTVTMRDAPTRVLIRKQSTLSTKELIGATLAIVDSSGNEITSWVTDGSPHDVTGLLIAGSTYTLVERKAPKGYLIAKPISFTVRADSQVLTVVMKDAPTGTSDLPDTGDQNDRTLWLGLLAGAALILLACIAGIVRQKRRGKSRRVG